SRSSRKTAASSAPPVAQSGLAADSVVRSVARFGMVGCTTTSDAFLSHRPSEVTPNQESPGVDGRHCESGTIARLRRLRSFPVPGENHLLTALLGRVNRPRPAFAG